MKRSWRRCLSGCESSAGAGGRQIRDNADSTDEFNYYPCYPGYPWFDALLFFALCSSWRRIRFLESKIAIALVDSNGVPFDVAEYRDHGRDAPCHLRREIRGRGGGATRRSALGGRR